MPRFIAYSEDGSCGCFRCSPLQHVVGMISAAAANISSTKVSCALLEIRKFVHTYCRLRVTVQYHHISALKKYTFNPYMCVHTHYLFLCAHELVTLCICIYIL
jgi:hypothetical protein